MPTRKIAVFCSAVIFLSLLSLSHIAPSSAATSDFDYALDFNQSIRALKSGIQVVPPNSTDSFTVESWVYVDRATNDWQAFIVQNQSTSNANNRLWFGLAATMRFHVGLHNGVTWDPNVTLSTLRWYHIALTMSGAGSATLYIDGRLADSTTMSRVATNATSGFSLGSDNSGNHLLDGRMDQVKVWGGALTQSQVQQSMNTYGSTGVSSAPTLRAHYDFNDPTGTTLLDNQANSNYDLDLTSVTASRFISVVTEDSSTVAGTFIYTFSRSYLTASGGWRVPDRVTAGEVLVVGGGGGGGDSDSGNSRTGGGGGAGGYFYSSNVPLSGTISVVVGQGGAGATSTTVQASSGGNSLLGSLKVGGGGGGNSVYYAINQAAGAGQGGSDFVSGGSGGGGRSRFQGVTLAINGGVGGSSSAVSFGGLTFSGNSGANGNNAFSGDTGTGGFGGAITEANRTSSITGSSIVYAKPGPFSPWSGTNQTPGSGGATNYFYGNPETTGNTLGGDGAAGVVIIRFTPDTTAPTRQSTSIASAGTSITLTYNETLSSTTAPEGSFLVRRGVSETIAVSSVTTSGSVVTLGVSSTLRIGESVSVTYTDPTAGDDPNAIQDLAGNDAASFNVSNLNGSAQKQSQSITFGALSPRTLGTGTVSLSASASSSLPVTFTSTTLSQCTVSNTTATLVSAGICSITASQVGNDTFTAASTVTRSFTISETLTITTPSGAGLIGTYGTPFSLALAASGGSGNNTFALVAPFFAAADPGGSGESTFSIASGSLPPGLSLSSAGIISGTPTATGSSSIQVQVSDSNNAMATTSSFTITIAQRPITLKASDRSATYTGSPVWVNNSSAITSGSLAFSDSITSLTYTYTRSLPSYDSTTAPTSAGTYTITPSAAVFSPGSSSNYAITYETATLIISTGSTTATISFTSTTFTFGITNPITVTTSVAGKVRFLANNKVIKNCKARATTLTGPFTATCSYRPDTRRPLTITAILTPTDTGFESRTSVSNTYLVEKRVGSRV